MINERGRVSWSSEAMITKDAEGAQTRCFQGGGAVHAANFRVSCTRGSGVPLGLGKSICREES